jgi:hypothetical protein
MIRRFELAIETGEDVDGGFVHIDDTIRYQNKSGRRERLTFLSPTKQKPSN